MAARRDTPMGLSQVERAQLRFALENAHISPVGAHVLIQDVAKKLGKKNRRERIMGLLLTVSREMKGGMR